MEIGLNLYSVRNNIKTEQDFLETAIKLQRAGYSYLQFSGSSLTTPEIKRVVETTKMPVYLTHMPMNRIIEESGRLMEEHASFGCSNIGLGAMPPAMIANPDACKKIIEQLNASAEVMEENGFKFYYHHHNFELYKWGTETVLDYMIKNAPFINFTIDTYWLQYGGVDVCDILDKVKGRAGCVHLKDYKVIATTDEQGNVKFRPMFAPLGDGNMNFRKIINKMREIGTQLYFVEQDNAADFEDPFEQVIRSVDYAIKEL